MQQGFVMMHSMRRCPFLPV